MLYMNIHQLMTHVIRLTSQNKRSIRRPIHVFSITIILVLCRVEYLLPSTWSCKSSMYKKYYRFCIQNKTVFWFKLGAKPVFRLRESEKNRSSINIIQFRYLHITTVIWATRLTIRWWTPFYPHFHRIDTHAIQLP